MLDIQPAYFSSPELPVLERSIIWLLKACRSGLKLPMNVTVEDYRFAILDILRDSLRKSVQQLRRMLRRLSEMA